MPSTIGPSTIGTYGGGWTARQKQAKMVVSLGRRAIEGLDNTDTNHQDLNHAQYEKCRKASSTKQEEATAQQNHQEFVEDQLEKSAGSHRK